MKEAVFWGIHGGRLGEVDDLFLKEKVIALGWHLVGDLGSLKTRESYKQVVTEKYPDKKAGAIPVEAGQLYRFMHELKIDDYVVYPSKKDKQVHLGVVEGEYIYSSDKQLLYPHRRKVRWLRTFPRTRLSQGALYEIGAAMSFFQIKNFAEEYQAILQSNDVTTADFENGDETVKYVVDEIEQTTRDFIRKRLSQRLKGHPLAVMVGHLFEKMGYHTNVSPPGADGGVDVVASKDELLLQPPILRIQVKSGDNNVGAPEVQALYGNVASGEYGVFVALSGFTTPAQSFAKGKSNLRLINGEQLIDLFLTHYDDLGSQYKGLIPLKQIFIPEPEPTSSGE